MYFLSDFFRTFLSKFTFLMTFKTCMLEWPKVVSEVSFPRFWGAIRSLKVVSVFRCNSQSFLWLFTFSFIFYFLLFSCSKKTVFFRDQCRQNWSTEFQILFHNGGWDYLDRNWPQPHLSWWWNGQQRQFAASEHKLQFNKSSNCE